MPNLVGVEKIKQTFETPLRGEKENLVVSDETVQDIVNVRFLISFCAVLTFYLVFCVMLLANSCGLDSRF